MKKRFLSILLVFCILMSFSFVLFGCGNDTQTIVNDDIIILFTNDVHFGIDENIGYAGLASYKKELMKVSDYVTLVDCGDFSQGGYLGTVSKGECAIKIMNLVGYDYVTLGNHEFDFGIKQLVSNIEKLDAKVLCCNLKYTGKNENPLKNILPYEIAEYGDVKVGFVGIATPTSINAASPAHFREDGERVYTFGESEDGKLFYQTVQDTIDSCRNAGADYVILLSHLGTNAEEDSPYTSLELIHNISGADVVLDAHSHSEIPCSIVKGKDGKDVLLTSTGTKLANIGRVVISANGIISAGYISGYEYEAEAEAAAISDIVAEYDTNLNTVVANIDFSMSCNDENGVRVVRNRETAVGNLVADAFRGCGESDIGLINGAGVRADLAGDITNNDLISVSPYGNMLCVIKVKGADLLDMLEYFYQSVSDERVKDGKPVGEFSSFQQISGLKVVIDSSVQTSVVTDEDDMLVSVGDTRRVKEVKVLKNGEYIDLDPNEFYTVTTTDHFVKKGGCGMGNFMNKAEIIIDGFILDYQSLIDYVVHLNGDLSAYRSIEGRIIIE